MILPIIYERTRGALLTKILFAVLLSILIWGVLRSTPPQQYFDHSDKAMHILAFSSVAFVGRLASLRMRGILFWPLMLIGAASLEGVQGMLWETRHFSAMDAASNLLGVCIAAAAYLIVKRLAGLQSGKQHPSYLQKNSA